MKLFGARPTQATRRWSVLGGLVSRYKGRMGILAAVSFLGALLEASFLVLVTGIAMALVAGDSSVGPYYGWLVPIRHALVGAATVLVVRLGLSLTSVAISARLTADVTGDQRHLLSDAYLQTSWAVQQSEPSGRLQELLTSFVGRVTNTVSTMTSAVTALLSLIAFLGAGLAIDAASTGAVLVTLGLVGGVLTPLRRRIRSLATDSARANVDFASAVSELGALGLEMQTFGVQHRFASRIHRLSHDTTATQQRVQFLTGALAPIYMSMAYAAALAGVALLALMGFGDVAELGAVMLLMLRSLSYGQQLAAASGSIAAAAPFLEAIRSTADRYRAAPAGGGGVVPDAVTPLVGTNVSYAYSLSRPALRGASFRLAKGEIVGVIGPSGAGKSTLAQLLLGLRKPTAGSLSAAGTELGVVNRFWWTRRVSFVPQDAFLFTGTVAENIRFFRDDIGEDDIRRAAAQANVLADIEALPKGLYTHLGERGNQLSGGQRQRITIARALVGDPQFLVLDEPTSALDSRSEALVRQTLASLRGKVTVVVIAHRMSTLDICDRVMVIESGHVTAFDTPEALRESSEFYRNSLTVSGIG
ncbi:ABC transporter ATP-binding protein [Intrasporangium calvum]|nr:ABC transporter ATP-binding protein [Intrasporangium calvum]